MKKVLIIITTAFIRYGGLTTVMMNYYHHMDKTGLRIDFASTNVADQALIDDIAANNSRYFCLGDRRKHWLTYLINLRRLLNKENYDIVHINGNSVTMLMEAYTAKICGVKSRIAHCHNSRSNNRLVTLVNGLLRIPFSFSYTLGIAVSKPAGEWAYGNKKYIILNNAIDTDKYRFNPKIRERVRNELNIHGKYVIGNVGKLNAQKNHSFLLDVFYEIRENHDDAVLLIVGGGELEKELKERCKALGIENDVIFTGMVNNPHEYLQAMDVFVFPSIYEGLGMSVIEAQASGLSCIASDKVPVETQVSDKIEYLSFEQSPMLWAEHILHLKSNNDRKYTSKAAFESICSSGYDINSEANKLRKIYLQ